MSRKASVLKEVILSFLKVGLIGFGGGSALIPIIEKEVVINKKLVDEETYTEHTIVANVTPGALPVKLGAASGEHLAGNVGMFAGAYSVALPGAIITIILLSILSILSPEFLYYIKYASIGVSAFIIVLLLEYISKVMVNSSKVNFGKQALIIMLVTVVCTFGKKIRTLISLFVGTLPKELQTPLLNVSTIDLLIVAFLIIAGTRGDFTKVRSKIVAACSVLFLIGAGDMSPVNGLVMNLMRFGVVVAIIVFVGIDGHKERSLGPKLNLQKPFKQSLLFILFMLVMATLSFLIVGNVGGYLQNGLISTVTSFGGGEAYLTVADGVFVGSGYVPSGDFYGKVLPIANALPGPILVKILAGVGYLKGFQLAGITGGYVMAGLGLSLGVGASVIVFAYVHEIYKCFSQMQVFKLLNLWILPVVCGLLISTIIAMLNESFLILHEANIGNLISIILFLFSFGVIYLLQKRAKLHDVIVLLLLAFITLGIILVFK